jgi:hypothetical protein
MLLSSFRRPGSRLMLVRAMCHARLYQEFPIASPHSPVTTAHESFLVLFFKKEQKSLLFEKRS